MDVTDVSIIHHTALVLLGLWVCASLGWRHPVLYFLALIYLYRVNEHYSLKLRRRLQFEVRKSASQRRLLSETESVRWLNYAVAKIWPICMEQIASQQFLLPIIPWFLDKYKPWTARKASVQHLYLGRNPPMFTEIRVLHGSADDDHIVLELGMSFLSADDMSAILAVQLRKRVGFGISAKMHVTGMHVEGKILVGVKFLRHWPFLGRVRICFVEQPYIQMTVKPIFSHGIDVTELPGIAGWLDKILAVAFEQTLVEPNMMVIDVEKFASAPTGNWFTVDEKRPIAFAKVDILEAADMKPSDMNGLADPYVKGQLGPYRFRTKIQKKTLSPKWLEEFKIPINSWETPNLLLLQVRDKDHIFDDLLGDCSININELRRGQRYDKWLTLHNVKMGRLHLAVTILEGEEGKEFKQGEQQQGDDEDQLETTEASTAGTSSVEADALREKDQKIADVFEPVDIEGHEKTGVWVHRPGSDVSQTWEPRKGRSRRHETELNCLDDDWVECPKSIGSGRSTEKTNENPAQRHGTMRRGFRKLGSLFRRGSKNELNVEDVIPSPRPNLQPLNQKSVALKLIVDDVYVENAKDEMAEKKTRSPEKGKEEKAERTKQLEKPVRNLKNALSRKISNKVKEQSEESCHDSNSSKFPLVLEGASINAAYLDNQNKRATSSAEVRDPVSPSASMIGKDV